MTYPIYVVRRGSSRPRLAAFQHALGLALALGLSVFLIQEGIRSAPSPTHNSAPSNHGSRNH